MTSFDTKPILSRPVLVDEVPDHGLSVTVESTEGERDALRTLNTVVAVQSLAGRFIVKREGKAGAVVTGTVHARIVQTCVVSLEPFETTLEEPVEVHFLTPEAVEKRRAERAAVASDPTDDDPDEPDVLVAGGLDLGAVTAEYLTLGLDPYPRKPGVRFEDVAPEAAPAEASPFAVLKALRPGDA